MCDEFQALFSGISLLEVATVNYNLLFAERRDSENFNFFWPAGLQCFREMFDNGQQNKDWMWESQLGCIGTTDFRGWQCTTPPSILKSQMVHINTLCGLRNNK